MSTGTGKVDKNGIEMKVGDVVHFKANGISGKGFVYLANEPDGLPEKFRIKVQDRGRTFLGHIRIIQTQHTALITTQLSTRKRSKSF